MPGAEWFPGARLNYAENVLSRARPGHEALRLPERGSARPPACPGTSSPRACDDCATALRTARDRQGRSRRRLPAEHARRRRRDARDDQHRRDLVGLRSGLRRARRARSLLAARAEAACSASTAIVTAASRSIDARRCAGIADELPTLEHVVLVPYLEPDDRRPLRAGFTALGRARCRRRRCRDRHRVRAGPAGPSALDPVLVGNDRAAEADRARSRRHHDRADEEPAVPHGRAARPADVLLHDDRLDDVELPRQRAAVRCDPGAVRRQPGLAGSGRAVADGRGRPASASSARARPTSSCWRGRVSCLASASICRGSRSVTLAGSPVTPECMLWFHENVKRDMWVQSGSGGTDVCSGFCGGVVIQPVYAGEIQAPQLGVALAAFDADGSSVVDEVGEMVITEPMPSMPVVLLERSRRCALPRSRTSRSIPVSGATATSSASTRAAAASCSGARMRR